MYTQIHTYLCMRVYKLVCMCAHISIPTVFYQSPLQEYLLEVVGALICYALLHSMCNFDATEMNM